MNTRDLEAFVAVVDHGSILAAAAQLHLTQPGVTRRVQSLENTLGVELLDRQSKPLRPTAAGRDAYQLGRRVLASLDDLRAGVASGGEVRGEFRFGITPFLADIALEEPLCSLSETFPSLHTRVNSRWSAELLADLDANRIDAALVYLPGDNEPPAGLARERLCRIAVKVIVPKTLKLPRKVTLHDLSDQRWVLNQDGCGFRRVLRRALEAAQLPFHVAVEAFDPVLRHSLIARGLGIGLTAGEMLKHSPYRKALRVIDVPEFKAEVRAWLVHRPIDGRLAAPLEHLRDALREALGAFPE
ncbi:LysR family transcriptional regulator [Frateuria terrea]|uniref:DNA-binding transcriptional regulator, LysR family n=1 Tax=Frateuria terrea TaxID=529704 RepID=A0A1H6XVN0_9GAMM|nr:LysR family transcriptional regulator [Frateuria terrea]SEJ32246.1 DNA-binding transcriptional regulator, LysR family [Frateuria terrea]SFP51608.1 DNA-binding transcriptional regulator, LysR family [Frateuria terrea]